MISQSNIGAIQIRDLEKRDLADYGVARFQDQIFDAVLTLWRRRESEGWLRKQLAERIDRDPSWVSKNLRAPGNWTLRIAGELIQGLGGKAEIRVTALEDVADIPSNYDTYEGYLVENHDDIRFDTIFGDPISAEKTNIEINAPKPIQFNVGYNP
jgi:hypothetical protein